LVELWGKRWLRQAPCVPGHCSAERWRTHFRLTCDGKNCCNSITLRLILFINRDSDIDKYISYWCNVNHLWFADSGAVLEENVWRGNAPKPRRRRRENRGAESAEWSRVWGGASHPQPTMGSGERRELPHISVWHSGAERRPETHFGLFWRPQNAPFCTYMLMLWVPGTVFHVIFGGRGQGRGLGAIAPPPLPPRERQRRLLMSSAAER